MDAIDLKIMSYLGENSRLSNREIGRRIGITEGTVRNRLDRLVNEDVLHTTALINIEKFPDLYIAFVGVKIDGRHLTECAARIEKLPSVLTTMIVTGRYDLFAVVLAQSHKTLVDFVTDQLSKVSGVKDSETYVVLRNYGQWIPADKLSYLLK
ncbi:MAG: Lrp/AsnC family transcriptional regulator [Candidatus Latescibacteria bacterium]|nr:Lrp/AsnC family transcriptional regulator [Candidatus Latescibacterota bacterium]